VKIRNGFVSNSSSSSFVIIGSFIDISTDEDFDNPNLIYTDRTEGNYIFGKVIAVGDYGISYHKLSIEELLSMSNEVKQLAKTSGYEIEEPSLITIQCPT
jgi:hypothetical protein